MCLEILIKDMDYFEISKQTQELFGFFYKTNYFFFKFSLFNIMIIINYMTLNIIPSNCISKCSKLIKIRAFHVEKIVSNRN